MKRLLRVGLVVATVGILMGGMILGWHAVTGPDWPDEDEPSAFLDVRVVTDSEELNEPVIEYADLTPEQQAFFEQAMLDSSSGTPMADDVDHSVWYEYDAVKYQNRTYEVVVSEI